MPQHHVVWAQSRHATVRRFKFETRPESSCSLNAEASLFSNGCIGDRTFGGRKRSLDNETLSDGTEPGADILGIVLSAVQPVMADFAIWFRWRMSVPQHPPKMLIWE